ncbi:MAG: hypothetical protein IIA89_02050 [Chloroflexi bacterium]|nr:hypothetical protein [Chloroflexota bacterium]
MTYSRRIRLSPMWVALALALAIVLLAFAAVPAFAHVHGITPLNDCGQANDNAGGNAAQGDPIGGLIPRDVGEAPLEPGDGGSGATDSHCPT